MLELSRTDDLPIKVPDFGLSGPERVAHHVKLHIGASIGLRYTMAAPFRVTLGKSYKIPLISHTTIVSF